MVGDEINRASPKTQSALLECMEERQVTVDNTTYQLETPFMVIATQNPIEMEGTYALPEAQRDRFMARVSVGYPVEAAEIAMLDSHTQSNPLDDLEPVADAAEIRKLIGIVGQVYVSQAVQRYAVALTAATRRTDELSLGASPRATLHLVRAAKAMAAHPGPRLRAARRRARAGPAGARAPPAAQRRGLDERPLDHRDPRRDRGERAGAGSRRLAEPRHWEAAMREALSGLTVRGRAFVAAGVTAIVCAIVLGQPSLSRVGVLVLALPLVSALLHRPQPLPAGAGAHRQPAAGRGRPAGLGEPVAGQRGPHAQRRPAAGGPPALRARHPAAVRARGHRPRLAPRRHLPGPLRRARPLRDRPGDGAGQGPVRAGRARPRVPDHGAAHGHAAHRPALARSRSAAPGPAPATTGRARSRWAAPRTSRSASTAAATTCAACTGAARPASAS